jgi:transcriptional regulator with XRE-family HTH domain
LTQKQLAAALGVESVTVSRWERGVSSPSLVRLRRIAELTATRIDDLVPTADTEKADAAELATLRVELAETRELVERVAQALDRLAPPPSSAESARRRQKTK